MNDDVILNYETEVLIPNIGNVRLSIGDIIHLNRVPWEPEMEWKIIDIYRAPRCKKPKYKMKININEYKYTRDHNHSTILGWIKYNRIDPKLSNFMNKLDDNA